MKIKIFCVVLLLSFCSLTAWANEENLYEFASSKGTVNIHVVGFNVAGESEIKSTEITEAFKEALRERKSVKFNIVGNPEDADLVISGEVKSFAYSENDPIDILIPIGLVVDLVTNQNYARLEFNIKVFDQKNEVAWKKNLKATLTKSDMPHEESINLIMKKAAKVFIKECFGRPR